MQSKGAFFVLSKRALFKLSKGARALARRSVQKLCAPAKGAAGWGQWGSDCQPGRRHLATPWQPFDHRFVANICPSGAGPDAGSRAVGQIPFWYHVVSYRIEQLRIDENDGDGDSAYDSDAPLLSQTCAQ